jgi:hypothetical protein
MADRSFRWNRAKISGDELRPVNRILQLSDSVITIAQQKILSSEFEYNHLNRILLEEDSADEKRFFFFRWEREALQKFVDASTEAYSLLLTETQNVWHTDDILAADKLDAENSTVSTGSG